ncbi:MAG: hypothetical protein QOH88_973 [Verrucomicrobiota bacterium]|jgi:hypothetical protein
MRSRILVFPLVALVACLTASVPAAEPNAKSAARPAPFNEKVYTFQQIEQEKSNLKDRIVRVEISKLLGEGEDKGSGMVRFIAKDSSKSTTPYGQVAFPREGLEKTGLQKEEKGPLIIYFQVHVVAPNAAAVCEAVGTKFSPDAKGGRYEW